MLTKFIEWKNLNKFRIPFNGWVTHVNEKQTFDKQWTEIVHQKGSLMALKENWEKNRLLDKLADIAWYSIQTTITTTTQKKH